MDLMTRRQALMTKIVSLIKMVATSATGLVSFDTNTVRPAKVTCEFAPVQDLHGYDSPWPAGGGKNKFDLSVIAPFNANVTVTKKDDSFTVTNNNSYDVSAFRASDYDVYWVLAAGQYSISISPATTTDISIYASADGTSYIWSDNGITAGTTQKTFTVTAEKPYITLRAMVGTGKSVTITKFQLETGSSATTYSPYSNICPISGWTGAEIEQTGVNVWDEEYEHGNINNSTGELVTDTSLYRSKNVIPVKGGSIYYLATNSNYNAIIYWYDKDMNYLGYIDRTANSTRTAPSNAYYARLRFFSNVANPEKGHFSVNYPATDTEYHPYTGNQISVNWEDEAGTVHSGNLGINEDGSADLHCDSYFIEFTGEEAWYETGATSANKSYFLANAFPAQPRGGNLPNGKSSIALYNVNSSVGSTTPGQCTGYAFTTGGGWIGFCFSPEIMPTLNDFKAFLTELYANGTPAQMYIKLLTEEHYHFDNIGQLKTFLGTNNIWHNMNGDITVEYYNK